MANGRLAGLTALITGGTSGIGLETARQFQAEGARVAVTGQSAAGLDTARSALGPAALVIESNAGDVGQQAELAQDIGAAFGRLDVLFINAGMALFQPLQAWGEADFDRMVAVNLKGPYFLIQAMTPLFNTGASVILNTSINAHIGMPNSSVYAACKAGLITLTRTLSAELLPRGVRVNCISPGPVATPLYGKLGLAPEDAAAMAEGVKAQIPLGRFGEPAEIAKAAVYLASPESAFMVGAEITLDGGMSSI